MGSFAVKAFPCLDTFIAAVAIVTAIVVASSAFAVVFGKVTAIPSSEGSSDSIALKGQGLA